MDATARMGRFFGWVCMVGGLALLGLGLLFNPAETAQREFERCQVERQIGRRAVPCPPPDGTDRLLLIAGGGSAFASGLFFVLLSGILATLVQMQAAQAAADQARRQADWRAQEEAKRRHA